MNRLLNRLSTLSLLLLYTFSFAYLAAGSFALTLDGLAPVWFAGICLSVWISADFRHGLLLGLPLSALILYIAYRTYDGELIAQLSDLFDRVTGAYYQRFYSTGGRYVYGNYAQDHSLILLFLCFLLASYLSTGLTSRGGRIFFSLIGTLPPVFFCLAVTGTPSVPAIAGLTLFWILLLAGGGRYQVDSPRGRAFFAAALPAILLTGLLLLISAPSEYVSSEKQLAISRRMEDFARSLRHRDVLPSPSPVPVTVLSPIASGPPAPSDQPVTDYGGDLDLTQAYDFSGMDDVILRAKTDLSGPVYLRSRSYGDYTGQGWLEAEDTKLPSSLPYAGSAAEGEIHEMELRLEEPSAFLFLPYFSALSTPSDSFVPSEGQTGYTVSFQSLGSASGLPAELRQEELDYRAYAHQAFTRLPDATGEALRLIAQQAGLTASSPDLPQDLADYVRNEAVYDLNVAAYPSQDYAVYFLTEARRGYCVHFATAAAALFRALGVPARVAEGFLYFSQPGEWAEIRRADAHAWVEIYSDGLGWLPVEVTGRSGLPGAEPGPAPAEGQDSAPPEGIELPQETPHSAQEREPDAPSPNSPGAAPAAATGHGLTGKILLIPAVLALLAALLPLQRLIRLSILRHRLRQRNRHKAAVAVYRQAVKLSAWGQPVPEAIRSCAEKAAFSNHEISPEELAVCRGLLEECGKQVLSQLKGFQRFSFRYLKCIM